MPRTDRMCGRVLASSLPMQYVHQCSVSKHTVCMYSRQVREYSHTSQARLTYSHFQIVYYIPGKRAYGKRNVIIPRFGKEILRLYVYTYGAAKMPQNLTVKRAASSQLYSTTDDSIFNTKSDWLETEIISNSVKFESEQQCFGKLNILFSLLHYKMKTANFIEDIFSFTLLF